MAIALTVNGITYRCDSVEEAVALGRAINPTPEPQPSEPATKRPHEDEEEVDDGLSHEDEEEVEDGGHVRHQVSLFDQFQAPSPSPAPPRPTTGELPPLPTRPRSLFQPVPGLPLPPLSFVPVRAPGWRQPPVLDVYWGRLDSRGREAISMIAQNDGTSIEDLRVALRLATTKEVSQVLAACKRTATAVGIPDYRHVFTYTIEGAKAARLSLYHAGPLLREEAP